MTLPRRIVALALAEARARKLLASPVEYVESPQFLAATPQEDKDWRSPMPGEEAYLASRARLHAPPKTPPQLRDHYEWPLLDFPQEQHLFRKMNYLRHLVSKLVDSLKQGDLSVLDRAEALKDESVQTRLRIFNANRRLVVGIARKFAHKTGRDFFEVLADGDVSLLAAIEKFDYMRGFKFSTYGYWAILKNYARDLPGRMRYESRFKVGVNNEDDDLFVVPEDDDVERADEQRAAARRLADLFQYLEPRERAVLRLRNGLDAGEAHTLEEIGEAIGVTKERARQLEIVARQKIQAIALALAPQPS